MTLDFFSRERPGRGIGILEGLCWRGIWKWDGGCAAVRFLRYGRCPGQTHSGGVFLIQAADLAVYGDDLAAVFRRKVIKGQQEDFLLLEQADLSGLDDGWRDGLGLVARIKGNQGCKNGLARGVEPLPLLGQGQVGDGPGNGLFGS